MGVQRYGGVTVPNSKQAHGLIAHINKRSMNYQGGKAAKRDERNLETMYIVAMSRIIRMSAPTYAETSYE